MKKLFAFFALGAMICFVSCQKPANQKSGEKTPDEKTPEEETQSGAITIDGSFEDWEVLGDKAIKVKNNPNSPYEAVKEFRIYNDAEFIYYYIAYDKDYLKELVEAENDLPIRLNFNTDGEFTSGYEKYFLERYDFMIEGAIANAGVWSSFDAPFYQRFEEGWGKPALLGEGSGLALGAGSGNEYEICVNIEMFNDAANTSPDPKPMGKTFQTGLTFYDGGWSTIAVLPNASIDDNADGWGSLLEYTLVD